MKKTAFKIDENFLIENKSADVILALVASGDSFDITEPWVMWWQLNEDLLLGVDYLPSNYPFFTIYTMTKKYAKERILEMVEDEGWEVVRNKLFPELQERLEELMEKNREI